MYILYLHLPDVQRYASQDYLYALCNKTCRRIAEYKPKSSYTLQKESFDKLRTSALRANGENPFVLRPVLSLVEGALEARTFMTLALAQILTERNPSRRRHGRLLRANDKYILTHLSAADTAPPAWDLPCASASGDCPCPATLSPDASALHPPRTGWSVSASDRTDVLYDQNRCWNSWQLFLSSPPGFQRVCRRGGLL